MHFPDKYFKVNEINEEKRKYLESIGYKMEFTFKPDAYVIIELKNLDEYLKLEKYILNIINLCSCRLNICITEEESAVDVINERIGNYFNECSIYYYNKANVLSEFFTVFYDDRANVVKHSNCIVHLNIPYYVNVDDYIDTYVDPIFGDNIENSFKRLFNSNNSIYVPKHSILDINTSDEEYVAFANVLKKNGIDVNLQCYMESGCFIVKTTDILKWKNIYQKTYDELISTRTMLYFISNMFDNLIFIS